MLLVHTIGTCTTRPNVNCILTKCVRTYCCIAMLLFHEFWLERAVYKCLQCSQQFNSTYNMNWYQHVFMSIKFTCTLNVYAYTYEWYGITVWY